MVLFIVWLIGACLLYWLLGTGVFDITSIETDDVSRFLSYVLRSVISLFSWPVFIMLTIIKLLSGDSWK